MSHAEDVHDQGEQHQNSPISLGEASAGVVFDHHVCHREQLGRLAPMGPFVSRHQLLEW